MQLAAGDVEFFFIDTSPFVQKYYSTPWANFTGVHPSHATASFILTSSAQACVLLRCSDSFYPAMPGTGLFIQESAWACPAHNAQDQHCAWVLECSWNVCQSDLLLPANAAIERQCLDT